MKPEQVDAQRDEARKRDRQKEEEERNKKEELKKREKEQKDKVSNAFKKRGELTLWQRYGPYTGYAVLGLLFLFVILSNFAGDRRKLSDIPVNEESFITAHNDLDSPFKLGKNKHFEGLNLAKAREFFANSITTKKTMPRCNVKSLESIAVKDAFNFYTDYPECHFEEEAKQCAAGYAEIPLSIFRNRNCLRSKNEDFKPSTDFVFRCNTNQSKGCQGGYVVQTLNFLRKGLVNEQCWNKEIGEDKGTDCPLEKLKSCEKRFVGTHCALEGEEEVKKEVQSHGPVLSIMIPYRDFLIYRSGDYVIEEKSKLEGMMIVKIIGWETLQDGTAVWLVDPMFGRDFGVNGVARVRMGSEESLFEKFAYTFYTENPDFKDENAPKETQGEKTDEKEAAGEDSDKSFE